MSAIERVLNRLEEKILVSSEEVTGQSQGTLQGESMGCAGPFPSHWRGFSEAASIAGRKQSK